MTRKKVLLVDDSSTVLLMHQVLLRQSGYELLVARNGQEAVDKASSERPDLILMDVVMPRMTGFEAVKELRAKEATKNIPIIMVTTRGEPVNVEAGFAVGCTEYITKPCDGIELLSTLRNYLGDE